MKKLFVSIIFSILILTALSTASTVSAAKKVAEVVNTDIKVYIDGVPIRAYNIDNSMVIVAEDLDLYGFDLIYNNSYRTLCVMYDPEETIESTYVHGENTAEIGSRAADAVYSNIVTYVEGRKFNSYNIAGSTVISVDDLAALYGAGYEYNNSTRSLSLTMPDEWNWAEKTEAGIKAAIESHTEEEVNFTVRNREEDIDAIVDMIRALDNATYYYLKWFSWNYPTNRTADTLEIGLTFTYDFDKEVVDHINSKVDGIVKATEKMTDYEKAKYVHDYIIDMVEYDYETLEDKNSGRELTNPNCYNIVGAFYANKVVCQGYAETYKYIMDKLGIECLIVGGPNHAWNLIKLDGEYYHVDATWDDRGADKQTTYMYFCINDEWINRSHDYDPGENTPESTSMKYNWYVLNDLYFEEYDYSKIKKIIQDGIRDRKDVEFAFADKKDYERIITDLLENNKIHEIYKELGYTGRTIWSVKDEDALIFKLLLTESF